MLILVFFYAAPIPYTAGYMNHYPAYPPPIQGGAVYNGYRQPPVHMGVVQTVEGTTPHGSSKEMAASGMVRVADVPTAGGAVWGGLYDPSLARR